MNDEAENSYAKHIKKISSELFSPEATDCVLMTNATEWHKFVPYSERRVEDKGPTLIPLEDHPAQEIGENYVLGIVEKLRSSKNSKSAQALDEFLSNNDIQIAIIPSNDVDGNGAYFEPEKEGEKGLLQIGIRSSVFNDDVPEAYLAKMVGHEIGHCVDDANKPTTLDGSDRKVAENFADAFGASLAQDAGYNLADTVEFHNRFLESRDMQTIKEGRVPKPHIEDEIPTPEYKEELTKLFIKGDNPSKRIPQEISDVMGQFTQERADSCDIKEGIKNKIPSIHIPKRLNFLKESGKIRKKLKDGSDNMQKRITKIKGHLGIDSVLQDTSAQKNIDYSKLRPVRDRYS